MKTAIIPIHVIVIDEKLYPRDKLNDKLVLDYFHAMKKGNKFPDIYVALFQGKYILVDGRHRIEAKKYMGEDYIQADIKSNFPSMDDIYLASVRANIQHGLRYTVKDKLKVAFTMSDLKFDTADITKLVGITGKVLTARKAVKIKHIFIKDKVKSGNLPVRIKDKMPDMEKVGLISDKEVEEVIEHNKEEFLVYELEGIYNFFVKENLQLESRKIDNLISKIKRLLKKKYVKL